MLTAQIYKLAINRNAVRFPHFPRSKFADPKTYKNRLQARCRIHAKAAVDYLVAPPNRLAVFRQGANAEFPQSEQRGCFCSSVQRLSRLLIASCRFSQPQRGATKHKKDDYPADHDNGQECGERAEKPVGSRRLGTHPFHDTPTAREKLPWA